jgi:hypothetical protein
MAATQRITLIYQAVDRVSQIVNKINTANKKLGSGGSTFGKQIRKATGFFDRLLNRVANLTIAMHGLRAAGSFVWKTIKRGVVEVNEEFAKNQLVIAGNLMALDMAPNLKAAKKEAFKLWDIMRRLAAPLPGETQDYMEVFRLNLPKLAEGFKELGETSLTEMAKFTSKFTAVAMTQDVDAQQIGRDMAMMFEGRVSRSETKTYMRLLTFMIKAAKENKIAWDGSTKAFNAMTAGSKVKLMQATIQKFNPLMDEFTNTLDAVMGGLNTVTKEILRHFTLPLFGKYRDFIKKLTKFLMDNEDHWYHLARTMGEKFVNLGVILRNNVLSAVQAITKEWRKFTEGSPEGGGVLSLEHATMRAGLSGKVAAGTLTGGPGGGSTKATAKTLWDTLSETMSAAGSGLIEGLGLSSEGLARMWDNMMTRLGNIWRNTLKPALVKLAEALGRLFISMGLVIRAITGSDGADEAMKKLVGGIELVAKTLATWIENLAKMIHWWSIATDGIMGVAARITKTDIDKRRRSPEVKFPKGWYDRKEGYGTVTVSVPLPEWLKKKKEEPAKAKRVYDFRYSRFDIKQQFAEGFDPDRIAATLADDLATLGEMKVQSNLHPQGAGG